MVESTRNELPRHPITGEILPHRDAMGVETFKVRVLDTEAVSKLMNTEES